MTIDTATTAFMQSIQNPVLTTFSKFLAIAFDPLVLILIAFGIATYLYTTKRKKQSILLSSTVVIAGILIKLLKEVFHKARPLTALVQETGYSLPSGHATMAVVFFGILTFILLDIKKQNKNSSLTKLLIILSATKIVLISGFTRIYLQVHWLTDVLAGFILGGIVLVSGIIIYKKH